MLQTKYPYLLSNLGWIIRLVEKRNFPWAMDEELRILLDGCYYRYNWQDNLPAKPANTKTLVVCATIQSLLVKRPMATFITETMIQETIKHNNIDLFRFYYDQCDVVVLDGSSFSQHPMTRERMMEILL